MNMQRLNLCSHWSGPNSELLITSKCACIVLRVGSMWDASPAAEMNLLLCLCENKGLQRSEKLWKLESFLLPWSTIRKRWKTLDDLCSKEKPPYSFPEPWLISRFHNLNLCQTHLTCLFKSVFSNTSLPKSETWVLYLFRLFVCSVWRVLQYISIN